MPQYNGVWTLEQQAQALTRQQWVTDPNFKNTTLLLQADNAANGATNNSFLDSSTNGFAITRNGNTTQGSFSPFSQAPGYWGNYFAAAADFISVPDSANVQFGSGDFTLEFFTFLPNTFSTQWITGKGDAASGGGTMFALYGTLLQVWSGGTNYDIVIPASAWPLSTWLHVAIVRNGTSANNLTLYVNGRSIGSASIGSNTVNTGGANPLKIGSYAGTGPICYISNYRFVKGTALYTSAFTPPSSPLTAVTNTTLLTCQNNRFIDNSTAAATITASGTASTQAFGPFAPALQWTPDVVGGSGYFDGTGDYIGLTDSSNVLDMGGSVTSLEGFFYPTSTSTGVIMSKGGGTADWSTSSGFEWQLQFSSSSFLFVYNASGSPGLVTDPTTRALNQWYYVAVATDASNNISLYVNGTRVATATNAITKPTSRTIVNIGQDVSGTYYFGYTSGMRFISGSGAYNPTSTTITVPTVPPTNVTNTKLLLNYTNAGIYDGKMGNVLETVGSAQVSTSPVKYGSGSISFNATSDLLQLQTSNKNTDFGTGDFTVEFWLFPTFWPSNGTIVYKTSVFSIQRYGSNNNLGVTTSAGWLITDATLPSTSAWTHVAVTRSGNLIKIWLNGVQSGSTGTSSASIAFEQIGGQGATISGFIDDLRATKVCRYFTTFTPPQQALPRQ